MDVREGEKSLGEVHEDFQLYDVYLKNYEKQV